MLTARYWTNSASWFDTKLHLRKAIKAALEQKGISIPYPQREVRVVGAALPLAPARGKSRPAAS